MKLYIKKEDLDENPENFLRRASYGFIRDRHSGKESFVKRLGNYHYPRLHAYIDRTEDGFCINLHLDQKQASYPGAHAHSAEYDGEVVEKEIERLKQLIVNN